MSQLALPLKLSDHAVFDTYWDAGNTALVAFVRDLADAAGGPGGWIWGAPATGKSHLLQAACERRGSQAIYLPFDIIADTGPAILDGVTERRFVCLDNIERIAGDPTWEHALFDLCNQLIDVDGTLLAAARATPRECGFKLADLQSRFSRLPIFRIRALDEAARIRALQHRARHRGLDLPVKTARFLMRRSPRDMVSLYRLLDRLDDAALRAKRRLTVPFAREVIGD